MNGFTPTEEQVAVMDTLPSGRNVKVIARAGTGKTETLNQSARRMRGKGLFTAFNRDIVHDSAARFPRHVQCLTTHKLAYIGMASDYRQRLNRSKSRQPSWVLASMLDIKKSVRFPKTKTVVKPAVIARLANSAVEKFCNSSRDELTERDIPHQTGLTGDQQSELAELILGHARTIWEDVQRTDGQGGGRFNVTPSHLLKMFAMRKPVLPYDFILLDEAQDTNPVVAELFTAQRHAQLIAVGDPEQGINEWRGAIDALEHWPADITLTLRYSFRFGEAIAEEGNKWLALLDAGLPMIGAGGPSAVGECEYPDAVLCRTNATAAHEVLEGLKAGRLVALTGDTAEQIAKLAKACAQLQAGRSTTHPELALFTSWSQVKEYVDEDGGSGGDLRPFVQMINDHGADVVLNAMARAVAEKDATLVVTTAHKAKGRQWNRVRIAADFREPMDEAGKPLPIPTAYLRLIYVAVTRARQLLDRDSVAWGDKRLAEHTAPPPPPAPRSARSRRLLPVTAPLPSRRAGLTTR